MSDACCYVNLVTLLLLNLMPLYRRKILTYIVVKDIFTGLLSTMKRCELFHNFQEHYNHILCKYRLLSKIYQFNKSSWWIPFSPAFPALCNLPFPFVKDYTYISHFTIVSSCMWYPEINLSFQSSGALHSFVRRNHYLS